MVINRFLVFIHDLHSQTDWADHLAPDGSVTGKVFFQKAMVDKGKLLCQSEGLGVICFFKIGRKLFVKTGKIKIDFLMSRVDPRPRKIFQSLHIHVLKVTDLGKLGPKRDVQ